MNKEISKNLFKTSWSDSPFLATFVGVIVSVLSGTIVNIFTTEQFAHIDIFLIIAFVMTVILFLLIGFLVFIFRENSEKVRDLKIQISSSFLDAIDKSSFNPTLKKRLE